jgi:hypothetical protein
LLNAAFAMAILALISRVNLESFVFNYLEKPTLTETEEANFIIFCHSGGYIREIFTSAI